MDPRSLLMTLAGAPPLCAAAGMDRRAQLVRVVDVADDATFSFSHKYTVMVGTEDVSNRCFRTEEYSDGTIRAFCYVKPIHVILATGRATVQDLQKEVICGPGTLTVERSGE